MSVLYFLIPLAFVIAGAAVAAFVWAARRGQFDDLDSPPIRALLDDDPVIPARTPGEPNRTSPENESATRETPRA